MDLSEADSNLRSRSWMMVYALLLGSMGTIIGYEFGMLNTFFKPFIIEVHGIVEETERFDIVSNLNFVLMIGITINSFVGSQLIAKYGRYRILLGTTIGNAVSFLILLIPSIRMMFVARFIGGFCGGFCFNLPSLMFKEVFPKKLGQTMASFFHIFHTSGIMIPYAFGSSYWAEHWRWVFLFPLFLEIPKLILIWRIFNIESTRWLFFNCADPESEIAIVYEHIYNKEFAQAKTENFLEEMKNSVTNVGGEITFAGLFGQKYFKPFLISIFLCTANQTSGIAYLVFYSRSILEQMNFENPTIITFFMGFMNVLAGIYITLFANLSSRRASILRGMWLQTIALVVLIYGIIKNVGPAVVVGLYSFMFSWGISLGGLLIPYLADIIPQAGISYAASFRWAINCFNAKLGLYLMNYFGTLNMFTIFVLLSLLASVVFARFGIDPEVKSNGQLKIELLPKRHSH